MSRERFVDERRAQVSLFSSGSSGEPGTITTIAPLVADTGLDFALACRVGDLASLLLAHARTAAVTGLDHDGGARPNLRWRSASPPPTSSSRRSRRRRHRDGADDSGSSRHERHRQDHGETALCLDEPGNEDIHRAGE
jgi:hypothetical protein